jgi:hypothetical protein
MLYSKNYNLPISSRDYEYAKNKLSEQMRGTTLSEEHKKNIGRSVKGKLKGIPKSEKAKMNMRKSRIKFLSENVNPLLGRKRPDFGKTQIGEDNPMFGKNFIQKWIEKYGEEVAEKKYKNWQDNQTKGKGFDNPKNKKIKCRYCGREIDKGNYSRWHGHKCKLNQSSDI